MTREEWQRIKQVMGEALDQPDTKTRLEFLSAACDGDRALQNEIEAMLAHAGDRLDVAADRLAGVPMDEDAAAAGRRLGDYELIREIGRGGMGTIYLARRADEEFKKEVAIKILKRGTDTDEVLRRFRAERQILAQLEHPNIARLIDAGTSPEGLPFFVMEYVDGVPITDFCDAAGLGVRERIELFIKVCGALHFAHQNLVVHRDLKPGNILITANSEPKLLDFGIAKLLSPGSDFLQTTIQNQQRFTPAYASPEQIRGDAVTTVSDVYALGALLYHLLTGEPPHRFKSEHPSPTELFSVILEQEPLRASAAIAKGENSEFGIRNPKLLRGDLDNILSKALQKDPAQRYSSVTEFADDLGRYVEGRPVRARRSTLSYRASKFVRRNKLGVAAAAALLLTLFGGIAATAWQARKAQRRFSEVRKLARAVVFDYHDLIAPLRGSTPVRERLVRDALEYLDNLARDAGDDPSLLRELASAYEKIGKVQGNSYYANLGDTEGALKSYRKSLDIRTRLLTASPENNQVAAETAKSHEGVGDVLYSLDDLRGARESYERAAELGERVVAARPNDRDPRLELALSYSRLGDLLGNEQYPNLGDTAGALAACRKAQELVEPLHAADPRDGEVISRLANALSRVGMHSCASGDVAAGLALQRRAVEIMERAAAAHPNNQNWAVEVLVAKHWLRFALEDNHQLPEAIALAREIIQAFETLISADPRNTNFRRNLGVTYNMLGKNLLLAGDVTGALASHQTALTISEEMSATSPQSAEAKTDVALSLWRLGRAQAGAGDHPSALERFRQGLALREPVITADPTNARARDDVASMYADLGNALTARGDFAGATDALRKAVSLAQEVSKNAPTNARYRARLALRYSELGRIHMQSAQANSSDAKAEWRQARDYLAKSSVLWDELRQKKILMPADAARPDEVVREIQRCDAAIGGSSPAPAGPLDGK